MIFAMVLLGMAQPAEQPTIARQRQSLTMPNEIAPAIFPYLQCMLEDRNARLTGVSTGAAARAAIEQMKADCQTERVSSETRAREMLSNSKLSEAAREEMIAVALQSIDHSRDSIAERLDRSPTQDQTVDPSNAAN